MRKIELEIGINCKDCQGFVDDDTYVIYLYNSIFMGFCKIYDRLKEESDASISFFDSFREKVVIMRIKQGCPM